MKNLVRVVFAMLAFAVLASGSVQAGVFEDVPEGHWAYEAIDEAVQAGILKGYNNKFHGKKVLNRFQIAVVVQRILHRMKGAGGGGDVTKDQLQAVEQLVSEFAEELTLLNEQIMSLKSGRPAAAAAPVAADEGSKKTCLSGLIKGGLYYRQAGGEATPAGGLTPINQPRFFNNGVANGADVNDSEIAFDIFQLSMGFDHQLNKRTRFYAHFDLDGSHKDGGISATGGDMNVNEAFLEFKCKEGEAYLKFGGFGMPFGADGRGPFRTNEFTISSSNYDNFWELWHPTGLEYRTDKKDGPNFILGLVTGTDKRYNPTAASVGAFATYDGPFFSLQGLGDGIGGIDFQEEHDKLAYYLKLVGCKKKGLSWSLGIFDNGGGNNTAGAPVFPEIQVVDLNIEYEKGDNRIILWMAQMDHELTNGAVQEVDSHSYGILINHKLDEKSNITLRYETSEDDQAVVATDGNAISRPTYGGLGSNASFEVNTITLCWNKQMAKNELLQFGIVLPDSDISGPAVVNVNDPEDMLIQAVYRVNF